MCAKEELVLAEEEAEEEGSTSVPLLACESAGSIIRKASPEDVASTTSRWVSSGLWQEKRGELFAAAVPVIMIRKREPILTIWSSSRCGCLVTAAALSQFAAHRRCKR
jgi:hypothetical protein